MVAKKVARAAASSTQRARTVAALALAAAMMTGAIAGCGPRGAPARRAVAEPREGYAYTAVLMAGHPLYQAVADLERALDELGDDEWEPVLEPIDDRFAQVAFLESLAFADPGERLAALREQWRGAYPSRLALGPEAYSPDLQARVEWEQRRADRLIAERVAAAEAVEGRRLAALRVELVKRYQERLTNLRITTKLGGEEEAQAAQAEIDRIMPVVGEVAEPGEVIEEQLEAERQKGRELLAAMEMRWRRQALLDIISAQERADEIAGGRREEVRAAGRDLYDEMIEELSRPWEGGAPDEVSAVAGVGEPNARLAEAEGMRARAEQVRREAAERQRRRLLAALGRLRARLKSGTEIAALVVAHRDGVDLQLLPGGSPRGENMTGSIAEKLEQFWSDADG